MIKLIKKSEWTNIKREPLQAYPDYLHVINHINKLAPLLKIRVADRVETSFMRRMLAANIQAEHSLEIIIFSYSAGASVHELNYFFPECIRSWQSFASYDLEYENCNEHDGHRTPHLDLYDTAYWTALQLICFAILLGHPTQLHNIMDLLIHENDDQDALLEALVAPYLPGRPGSTIYTRQLPYRKTRKIFQAEPDQRPALMAQYLKEWYLASRREPYHDRHKSALFPGYWSLEAGAITFILGIDDSTYRDMPFYPKDLVDYARSVSSPPNPSKPIVPHPPRKAAGEICPKTGWWLTMAKANSLRYFQQGVKFPNIEGSDYGLTFWQWSQDQLPPPMI
ncbi:PoNe immunity protein domain-containing protein [Pseudomonas syringae]|nr:DUF1911 domain-containing protein [Pseudomonas syringae]